MAAAEKNTSAGKNAGISSRLFGSLTAKETTVSGAIAFLIDFFERFDARKWMESDRKEVHERLVREQVGEVGAREEETLVPAGP